MVNNYKKIALIPTYEPDNNLIELARNLKKHNFDIIVIDDGSTEKYKGIFEKIKNNVKLISYQLNMGKGYAIKAGLKFIKEEYKNLKYCIVTMDSDGQHTVEDAIKLYEYVEKNSKDLVLGKRIRSKDTPLKSKMGNEVTKIVYELSTGINVYDTQTGLRAFSNELIDSMLEIEGDRYEYEMNVLLEMPQKGITIKEIEIKTIYIDNNSKSHFNAIKDSIMIYKQIIKFSLSSLCSFFADYILYSSFVLLTKQITLSNIFARILSGLLNYTLNKRLVFNQRGNGYKSPIQYFILALLILVSNTILLNIFVSQFKLSAYVAKIFVEMILFIFSWIVQNKIIFVKKEGEN